ncbi:MAG TPA: GNAT family N-acetyltransferase [Candidatus Thermoplasmatota archaeon]|nr:GNAT family N-acetyltransferase [Candidatus Thermoplasmatota archaeon]
MLEIRQVQSDDIFSVISLAYDLLPERYNPAIFNQFYESFPEGFLVAELNHAVIGFLVGIRVDVLRARILMLAVRKPHQRHQIGSQLLLRFLNIVRAFGATMVELEVRTNNRVAIEFYRKHGFSVQDTLSHFYQNGDAAYQMRRDL